MSIEHNKDIVVRYFRHFARHELQEALDLLSDDVVWWILGKPHLYPNAGLKTKADMAAIFERIDSRLENWLEMTVSNIIAEADRVAVEVESKAISKSGKLYNNNFGFFFTIRDDKIVSVREYFDVMHASETFRS